jgi:hypothetical protein
MLLSTTAIPLELNVPTKFPFNKPFPARVLKLSPKPTDPLMQTDFVQQV